MTFQEYTNSGQSIELLDSLYPPAMHVESEKAVFSGREQEFYQAWSGLLQDLANHLKQNGFEWESPTRCFNRIYFSADGRIDTYLYNFKPGTLSEEEEERFGNLLQAFAKDYQLELADWAESQFAQCGPVVYQNPN
jgi:hypothetical protein